MGWMQVRSLGKGCTGLGDPTVLLRGDFSHTLLQLLACHIAQGRRWQWRAGWGRAEGAQSSSRPELQNTGLHTAPRPQVVEH